MARIYRITNGLVGKAYIGFTTKTILARWREHLGNARRGQNQLLYRAIRKHGSENFVIEEIFASDDAAETVLRQWEPRFIAKHGTLAPAGYNLTLGGEGLLGFRHSDESRKKMSENMRGKYVGPKNPNWGKPLSPEHKARLSALRKGKRLTPDELAHRKESLLQSGHKPWNLGQPLSPEIRAKLSAALKGKFVGDRNPNWGCRWSIDKRAQMAAKKKGTRHTEATREKLRLAMIGKMAGDKHPMWGRQHTQETRTRMRFAHLGKVHSPEWRKNISLAQKGKKLSEETKRKIASKAIGRVITPETKAKISDALSGERNPFFGKTHSPEVLAKFQHRFLVAAPSGVTKEVRGFAGVAAEIGISQVAVRKHYWRYQDRKPKNGFTIRRA